MPSVYVVGGEFAVCRMFENEGWTLADNISQSDLVCFTGGEDVTPALYGSRNRGSYTNLARDAREIAAFQNALDNDKPCVGICRGGQFLNVMSGGRMIQDISYHGLRGTHEAFWAGGEKFPLQVTSTHHQMMWPSNNGQVFLYARGLADILSGEDDDVLTIGWHDIGNDVEGVWYEHTKCMCFQPHPEFSGDIGDTRNAFFVGIKKFTKLGV